MVKKAGTSTINEFDDASLQKVVQPGTGAGKAGTRKPGVYACTRAADSYQDSKTFYQSTANIQPEYRARAAEMSIKPAAAKDITAAGFLEDQAGFSSMMNSKGLFAYSKESEWILLLPCGRTTAQAPAG